MIASDTEHTDDHDVHAKFDLLEGFGCQLLSKESAVVSEAAPSSKDQPHHTVDEATGEAVSSRSPARRMTKQRLAIHDLVQESEEFLSAQQIHDRLTSNAMKVGLATVYRTLQSMADDGEVDVVRSADGEHRYRRCETTTHHHHLVCERCGRAEDISGPEVERWVSEIAAKRQFYNIEHHVELAGVCHECWQRDNGK